MTASLPPKKEVTYDSPLNLTCSATGIDISWQWYQNGTQIEDTTGMQVRVYHTNCINHTIQLTYM